MALTAVIDACFTRVGKEKAYTVALADKTFVDLFRQILVAGEDLVAYAGVTKYQDAEVAIELLNAALTDDPGRRVRPPSLENYPILEQNERTRNERRSSQSSTTASSHR